MTCGRRGHRKAPCTECGGCFTCCDCFRNYKQRHKRDAARPGLTLCGLAWRAEGGRLAVELTAGAPSCPRCARVWSAKGGTYRTASGPVARVSWQDRVRAFFEVTGRTP
jgi:hypothetical protein